MTVPLFEMPTVEQGLYLLQELLLRMGIGFGEGATVEFGEIHFNDRCHEFAR